MYFPAAILVYYGCTTKWQFQTRLCKLFPKHIDKYLNFEKMQRPKTWRKKCLLYLSPITLQFTDGIQHSLFFIFVFPDSEIKLHV